MSSDTHHMFENVLSTRIIPDTTINSNVSSLHLCNRCMEKEITILNMGEKKRKEIRRIQELVNMRRSLILSSKELIQLKIEHQTLISEILCTNPTQQTN
jgi:hypothetical protein